MTTSVNIGQKLWSYCNVLRQAGLSYGDYLEQLTFLIFLKMMDERRGPAYILLRDYQPPPIPDGYGLVRPECRGTVQSWRLTTAPPWRCWAIRKAPWA